MRAKLALSTLCENPLRRTGLSTLFPEFVAHARRQFPEVEWLVFAGSDGVWDESRPGVEVCRSFPSNERPVARLLADQFSVGPEARRRGASALLTVGFHPIRSGGLPVAMHVFAVGDAGGGRGPRAAYRGWAVGRGLRRARIVITNSEWAKAQLGAATAPVLVSPEGLRHDLFRPEGPRGIPGLESGYFLWASNFYPYKRVELVLGAYAALPAAVRAAHPFVLAGGDWRGGRTRAEGEAVRLGVSGDVRFLGWVDDADLPGLYRGALAHVLSTSRETFGRSVLEAMACGCPNVVQDLPVLREVAGDCASFVDFSDSAAAAGALAAVAGGGELRSRMAAAGAERSGRFSFERLARERVGAILGAIGAGGP